MKTLTGLLAIGLLAGAVDQLQNYRKCTGAIEGFVAHTPGECITTLAVPVGLLAMAIFSFYRYRSA